MDTSILNLAASTASKGETYHVAIWVWVTVLVVVIGALLLDLLVFNRNAHEISMKEAAYASLVWIALGVAFGIFVIIDLGGKAGGE